MAKKSHRWFMTLGLLAAAMMPGSTLFPTPGGLLVAQQPGRLVLAEPFTSTS